MTRGPPPKKGLGDATSVAAARGTVMRFVREPEGRCDFLIRSDDRLILVRVRMARRNSGSAEEMEREFSAPIQGLRTFPRSAQIIPELWTYSRRGIWRFFRIGKEDIAEIHQDGTPLKNTFVEYTQTIREVHSRKKGIPLVKGTGLG
jgi:hypothetical protein